MKNILRKMTALVMVVIMLLSIVVVAEAGVEYSVEDAYYECAEIYPEFVAALKADSKVTDRKIITFLESLQEYLLNLEVEVTEENFEQYLIESIQEAITLRKNIAVRDALIAAFPEAAVDGMDGIIHEDFIPIVETVKRIIFENGLLDEETDVTEEEKETKPTEEETQPTEKETVAPTETETVAPTEKETEGATEEPTQAETQAPTEAPTSAPVENEKGDTGTTGTPVAKPENGVDEGEGEEETEENKESATTPKTSFSDMNQAVWAQEAVDALVDMNIISGYPDGTFLPNKSITRAEFAKIIVLASGRYDKDAKCSFADVPENQWYYSYVASAYELGFITGRSDTVFDPNSNITRADLCVIVYRYIKSINSEFKPTKSATFADGDKIPSYAKEAVNALYSASIVGGMGENKFEPLTQATRAQSAKIVYGAIKAALGM